MQETNYQYQNNEAVVVKTNKWLISVRTDKLYKSNHYPIKVFEDDSKNGKKSIFIFRLTNYEDRNNSRSVTFALDIATVKYLFYKSAGYPVAYNKSGQYYGGRCIEKDKNYAYYWSINRVLFDRDGKARNRDILINCKNGYCKVVKMKDGTTQMKEAEIKEEINIQLTNEEWFSILCGCMEALDAKNVQWAVENAMNTMCKWLSEKLKLQSAIKDPRSSQK